MNVISSVSIFVLLFPIMMYSQNMDLKILMETSEGDRKEIVTDRNSHYLEGTIYFFIHDYQEGFFIHQPEIHATFPTLKHHFTYFNMEIYQEIVKLKIDKCERFIDDIYQMWLCGFENRFEHVFRKFYVAESVGKSKLKVYEVRYVPTSHIE